MCALVFNNNGVKSHDTFLEEDYDIDYYSDSNLCSGIYSSDYANLYPLKFDMEDGKFNKYVI